MSRINFIIILLLTCVFSCKETQVYSFNSTKIPFIDSIEVDGNNADWGNKANTISFQSDLFGTILDTTDIRPLIHLGWSKEGLCIFAEIHDDSIAIDYMKPWQSDNLELFISDTIGGKNLIQFIFFPPDTSKSTGIRQIFDFRAKQVLKKTNVRINNKQIKTNKGYNIEAIIPFDILGKTSSLHQNFAIQLIVNERDVVSGTQTIIPLYPHNNTIFNTHSMLGYHLDYAKENQSHINTRAYIIDAEELNIQISTEDSLNNNSFIFTQGQTLSDTLALTYGKSIKSLSYKKKINNTSEEIEIKNNGKTLMRVSSLNVPLKNINRKPLRFEDEIRSYEYKDKISTPQKGMILFVGSSSIRLWKTLEDDMPGMKVFNRGVGGTTAADLLFYMDRIVLPYQPAEIVYYEGDNDMGAGIAVDTFIKQTQQFIRNVHQQLPNTKIHLLSIKPSPRRFNIWPKVQEANKKLDSIAQLSSNVHFINVADILIDNSGNIDTSLFIFDGIHLNSKGYQKWSEIVYASLRRNN